jgi:arsenate reductase
VRDPVSIVLPVADLTVYEKRTCTTCRRLAELLDERGVDFDRVEYHVEGLPEAKLRELLRKGGLRPADVLRRREPLVAELGLDGDERALPPDDALIRLMAEHPRIVQRPIVERGDRAVLARPVARVLDLL